MKATYSPLQATKEILVLVMFVSKSIVLPSITMVRYLLIVKYGSIIGIIGKLIFYITASEVSTITCGLHCRSISSLQIVQGLEVLETVLEMADLTFRGSCIMIYSYNNSNKMHLFLKFIFGIELYMFQAGFLSTIQVLLTACWRDQDGTSVHHQESSTVYTAKGVCHTGFADCLLAGSGQNICPSSGV